MNIYVGNLPYQATDADLRQVFEQYGEVSTASVIMDRQTGRSRGFGFVEMANEEEARTAIDGTNGTDMMGRALRVNEARPKPQGGGGGGGRGGYRGDW